MSAEQQSIQQQRASFALQRLDEVLKQTEGVQSRFNAYSNSLPAMIQINGIGQALAFAWQKASGKQDKPNDKQSDESQAWRLLFETLDLWLVKERGIWQKQNSGLLKALTGGTQHQYQLAQAEAQALLSWVKDFARAQISGEGGD